MLKIGGSVITDKSEGAFEKVRMDKLDEICRVIADFSGELILVHGAGSFGHPQVKKYGIEKPLGVSNVHLSCLRLNEMLCRKLVSFGVAALPIHPIEVFRKGRESEFVDLVGEAVERGFLPVLHGDVVFAAKGYEVLSGDNIAVLLAEKLNASRIGFATDVEGILVGGKVVNVFDSSMMSELKGAEKKADVTGGMRGKVEKIVSLLNSSGCRAFIFRGNAENVAKFLRGERVGTEVVK